MMPHHNAITDVPGIEVGHATDPEALTGCTVILCRAGAVCGVDVRGGGPGTRETDLLDPSNMVDKVNAVVLSGGSAFGLESATGTVRWLEEHSRHLPVYSDSRIAIGWVRAGQCRTNLARSGRNAELFELIAHAEGWLAEHRERTVLKWDTSAWGENPADFGRK